MGYTDKNKLIGFVGVALFIIVLVGSCITS